MEGMIKRAVGVGLLAGLVACGGDAVASSEPDPGVKFVGFWELRSVQGMPLPAVIPIKSQPTTGRDHVHWKWIDIQVRAQELGTKPLGMWEDSVRSSFLINGTWSEPRYYRYRIQFFTGWVRGDSIMVCDGLCSGVLRRVFVMSPDGTLERIDDTGSPTSEVWVRTGPYRGHGNR
jgi:hypothetical protein